MFFLVKLKRSRVDRTGPVLLKKRIDKYSNCSAIFLPYIAGLVPKTFYASNCGIKVLG
jgi:hypothetical protein